jgi:hypothetical protein
MLANSMSNLNMQNGTLNRQPSSHYISPNLQQQQTSNNNTKAIINQNEYHVIELRKPHTGGFGFSIRGGREFNIPLFVLKLAENGPAALDGRLQIGDQILEINSQDAYNMTHGEAIERIKQGGNCVTLLVRRTGLPPPSITDIIAVNSSVQQQQQQMVPSSLSTHNIMNSNDMIMRSKSPYLHYNNNGSATAAVLNTMTTAQSAKTFNTTSTSALLNRNY